MFDLLAFCELYFMLGRSELALIVSTLKYLILVVSTIYTDQSYLSWHCFSLQLPVWTEKAMFIPTLTIPMRCFFYGSFWLFMFHVCLYYTVMSVPCTLEITFWERTDLLALSSVMFPCVFIIFVIWCVWGRVWYLIVSIPDLYLLYFL